MNEDMKEVLLAVEAAERAMRTASSLLTGVPEGLKARWDGYMEMWEQAWDGLSGVAEEMMNSAVLGEWPSADGDDPVRPADRYSLVYTEDGVFAVNGDRRIPLTGRGVKG